MKTHKPFFDTEKYSVTNLKFSSQEKLEGDLSNVLGALSFHLQTDESLDRDYIKEIARFLVQTGVELRIRRVHTEEKARWERRLP